MLSYYGPVKRSRRNLPTPHSAPPDSDILTSSGIKSNHLAENQAEVGSREEGFGVGQKLAEVCDGDVLKEAAEAVQFDGKGLRKRVGA